MTIVTSLRNSLPSAPMFVKATPLSLINSKALLTFSTFWILIFGFLLYLPRGVSPMISYYEVRQSWRLGGKNVSRDFATHQELNQSNTVSNIFSQVIDMRDTLYV